VSSKIQTQDLLQDDIFARVKNDLNITRVHCTCNMGVYVRCFRSLCIVKKKRYKGQ
jgi:hypothetical protein